MARLTVLLVLVLAALAAADVEGEAPDAEVVFAHFDAEGVGCRGCGQTPADLACMARIFR